MAKYVFFNFPASGHVNPTLAIVEELIKRGEQVVYYLPERFRQTIEATGATFHAYQDTLFTHEHKQAGSPVNPAHGDQRLAMLPTMMIQESLQVVPQLLESVRADQADCLIYDSMFLWGRMMAQILHITYGVPSFDMRSVLRHTEPLKIVFLPRAFQPGGEMFDESYLFVGPSFQPNRDKDLAFPFEQLGTQPLLYISLGTVFNHQADFYRGCLTAFGETEWQVVLSVGPDVDRTTFPPIPGNFFVAPRVPQLEVLARANLFISHGGMNSTMESLSYGVPLVVIPQISEQAATARRVQELGLGIALDREMVTAERLREAVAQVAHDPSYRTNAHNMQNTIIDSGGYQRATDAVMQFALTHVQA